ncbi:MAG: class I SAM-dependent methyltransferase [Bacteroidetes bacterium]|jgi:glycine/sarcosine N-methyltransferase|nr:class I SAM-dependent methyltransferase [Bacteroidota bacterium]MBT4400481.1 class I SAM-dependent methyltransferase [Bacteroidota bacterium]MBT4410492.1 class I SAM-dependent methyltransferase [Bacteroidota bacterium]MBT5426193.1 class I SAM-dependent methyltransferase [Bacteroidota bacterium]MBT7093306.1 class I SAM-dependent methyltransferase [Bacteroidota bacterium]
MNFYTSIAELYDEIFPYKPVQKRFVEGVMGKGPGSDVRGPGSRGLGLGLDTRESSLLDVGCGTGSLVLNLSDLLDTVIGIDPDKEMLQLANLKAMKYKADRRDELEDLGKWVFVQKGMLDLTNEFVSDSFNSVICFGNTLVHLSTIDEVKEFIRQAFEILKPGGYLMIQIINYDRIIDQKLRGLPTIENENQKFERIYQYNPNPEVIRFQTKLTVKESGEIIENDIPLLAVRPGQLKKILKSAGFINIQEYGNFKGEGFGGDSQAFIIVGRKEG